MHLPMPEPHHPHPPAPKTFVAGRVVGDYEIIDELGRGGMGVVYRARQITLNRIVGLKMLTGHYGPDELTRFLAEAETAAGLHHTNIIQIYEVGEFDGAPFYSMEYVESGSLADRLRSGRMDDRYAAQLLISVARALQFAHRNEIVHRDMKPANVLLDPEGVPKVADFGIAKRLTANAALTLSGAVIGTPTYMAPEQAKGTSRDVGAGADIYALGAILYEMLAGRPPFLPDDSETALTVRVITEDPVSPAFYRPGVPGDLETICMKCLEKAPRDRYDSAAAFAEDLRRFLDDESIMARPPTTVVRTVKWIRRHPWRTSFAVAAVLCLGIGLEKLRQWEFYERPQTEWGQTLEIVNGVARPVVRSNAAETSKRSHNLRFTRSGRFGPITRMEIVNSRGRPAITRELFGFDVFANLIEGAMGAAETNADRRETTRLDFVYTGDELRETVGLDRNGRVTWRLLWDRTQELENDRRLARARFVDLRGFDFSSAEGASVVKFVRDAAGRDLDVRFFNGSGKPAANEEEVFGFRIDCDSAGRLVQLTNLDQNGQPMKNRLGMIAEGFAYTALGQLARLEYRDGAGRAAPWHGIAVVTLDYDAAGNIISLRRWSSENKLVNGEADGWAAVEHRRNAQGETIEWFIHGATPKGGLTPLVRTVFEYDAFGYPIDSKRIGGQNSRIQWVRDGQGNVLEKRLVNLEGQPVTGSEGWSIARYSYAPITSPPGWREEMSLFDTKGEKTWHKSEHHHRSITEFSATGDLRRVIREDQNPAPFGVYRLISEPEFDAQNRLRKHVWRREDKEGKLIRGPGATGLVEQEFDEKGRPVNEWQTDSDVETFGAPALHIKTEWRSNGALERIVRQACDAERKPLASISNGRAARMEEEYGESDRRERMYESGFDEKLVGFSSREAKFSEGVLQSVTHRRSDGTALDAVRTIVVAVGREEPEATEFKPGDELLSVNGDPIRSMYHLTMSNFPGGWIEVLRDGKSVRIEGLEPEPLDLRLEDRALKD